MKLENSIYILATLTIFGCSSEGDDNPTTTTITDITYDTHVKSIIITNCIACHDNPPSSGAPMPLTTYVEVKEAVLNRGLIERINSSTNPMPPKGGPLPKEQRDIIQKWERDGLLEK